MRNVPLKIMLLAAMFFPGLASAQEPLPPAWSPRDIKNSVVALWASHTDALRQEEFGDSSTAFVGTPLTSYSQNVGTAYLCQSGHIFTAISSAYRPIWQNDASGGRNNFFRLGTQSQASNFVLQNSTGALRHIHQTGCFTIALWLRMQTGGSIAGDGANQTIFDSNANANTYPGLYLQRDSSNKLEFDISGSGSWITTGGGCVSSSTITSSAGAGTFTGWCPVVITGVGPGTNTCTMYMGGSVTNGVFVPTQVAQCNISSGNLVASGGTDPHYNFTIGTEGGGTGLKGQFDFDSLVITDGPMESTDLTKWYNFNPAATSVPMFRESRHDQAELDPLEISHCWGLWDTTHATNPVNGQPMLFQDNAASSAVTATGQNLEWVENYVGAPLKRAWYYNSSPYSSSYCTPTYPTWLIGPGGASSANGFALPCAYFNGSNGGTPGTSAPAVLQLYNGQAIPPGDKTILYICQQNNNAADSSSSAVQVGSHFLTYSGGATAYWPLGGNLHSSPWCLAVHPTGSSASSFFGTYAPTITAITVSGSSGSYSPFDPRGTYTLVNPPSFTGGSPGYFGFSSNAFQYYSAGWSGAAGTSTPTGPYLWFGSGNIWYIGSTLGTNGSGYWKTSNAYPIGNVWTTAGTASGTISSSSIPSGGGNTASGMNLYHLRCKSAPIPGGGGTYGFYVQAGVNGVWSPWFGDSTNYTTTFLGYTACGYPLANISLCWDSWGNDSHFNNGANPGSSEYLHYELNGYVPLMAVWNYAVPDTSLNKILRRQGRRFNIQSMAAAAQ